MLDINDLIKFPQKFADVKEKDIEYIAEEIYPFFKDKIEKTADIVGSTTSGNNSVLKAAISLNVKDIIKNGIYTYLAHKKWQSNIPITPYLFKIITRMGKSLIVEDSCRKQKRTKPTCLACKEIGRYELLYLTTDNKLKCNYCVSSLEYNLIPQERIKLVTALAIHSLEGVRCPLCKKFVPDSCMNSDYYFCPYTNCEHVFKPTEKDAPIKHPVSHVVDSAISLNNPTKRGDNAEIMQQFCNGDETADNLLIKEQSFDSKFNVIKTTIDAQKKANGYTRKIPLKACMYQAFADTLMQYPEDMVDYLTIGRQASEVAIQSAIFQNFTNNLEEILPITVYINGDKIHITTILDEKLNTFNGVRLFSNFVDNNYNVKRRNDQILNLETNEYIEDVEPSFIGKLISIEDTDGNDLIDYVINYNFSSIIFKNCPEIKKGIDVSVVYYSTPPSYCIGAMTYLQRIKKKLSDSINKKLK